MSAAGSGPDPGTGVDDARRRRPSPTPLPTPGAGAAGRPPSWLCAGALQPASGNCGSSRGRCRGADRPAVSPACRAGEATGRSPRRARALPGPDRRRTLRRESASVRHVGGAAPAFALAQRAPAGSWPAGVLAALQFAIDMLAIRRMPPPWSSSRRRAVDRIRWATHRRPCRLRARTRLRHAHRGRGGHRRLPGDCARTRHREIVGEHRVDARCRGRRGATSRRR